MEFDTGLKEMHGRRVAQGVGAYSFGGEGCLVRGCGRNVTLEDRHHAEAGDAFAVGVHEKRRVWMVLVTLSGYARSASAVSCQRGQALLVLSQNTHLCGVLKAEVLDVQIHRLGCACAGVVQEGEQREVTQTETVQGNVKPAAL